MGLLRGGGPRVGLCRVSKSCEDGQLGLVAVEEEPVHCGQREP